MLVRTDRPHPIFIPVRSAVCADKIVNPPATHTPLLRPQPGTSLGRCQACPVQGLSLCDSLHADEIAELDALVAHAVYQNRTMLFEQGAPETYVHVVGSGMVRLFRILPDGRRMILGFALPGDFLGLSLDEHYGCSAEALGDVSTCKIKRVDYSNFLNSKPHLMRRFHTETAQELLTAQDQMVLLGRCSAREKVAIFLLNMRNRWRRVNGQSTNILLPMPRQDIGDYLGLTVETVSRLINIFAREKLIVIVPDGVRILDLTAIEAISTG